MPPLSQVPVYNLKFILKETGVKADALRAWERRYDLPKPQRTSGGHRLYSEYDIETVKWLRARQAEGISISQAVGLWKETIETGSDPLAAFSTAAPILQQDHLPAPNSRLEIYRQKWLEANLAFDSNQVDEILNQAFAIYPIETVCSEIIQQGISDIGNYWVVDKATIQQEHFASALASRRLETLIAATPQPTRRWTIFVGCPAGERHTLPILLLVLFLRRRGLNVVYLGADIPNERLVETTEAIKPDLIILGAQQLSTAAALQSAARILQGGRIPLAYGGLIFNRIPLLREVIPAYFLGETLNASVNQIENLLVSPPPPPTAINASEPYRVLAKLYRERRSQIEMGMFEDLQNTDLQYEHVAEANFHLGNELSAALQLGDPAFLEADLEWVKRLLVGRHIPAERLMPYLAGYSRSMMKVLGEAGAPITNWMGSYLDQNVTSPPPAVYPPRHQSPW